MFKVTAARAALSAASIMVCILVASHAAQAQTTIGVGQPGPVQQQQGLLGTYYNYPTTVTAPPGSPPGSPATTPPPQNPATQCLQRIDGPLNIDYNNPIPPGVQFSGSQTLNFMVVYTGFIKIDSAVPYIFGVASDDGERGWFGNVTNTTPDTQYWNQRGIGTIDHTTPAVTEAIGRIPVRIEFEQGNGGAAIAVYWNINGAGDVIIPAANLIPPDGPDAPTGLTATGSNTSVTPQITVTWNASTTPIAATSYILSRATVSGGPYTQVAVQSGTTFVDTTVSFGQSYYYIVQGTATTGLQVGPASGFFGPVSSVLPPVSVDTTTVTTSESGTNATLTLTVNISPTAAGTITITSSNQSQAIVSGQGNGDASVQGPGQTITLNVLSGTAVGTTIPVTVSGVDDFIAQTSNQTYTITMSVAGGGAPWTGAVMPIVNGTNIEGDVAGLVVSPTSGLTTNTNGGQASFSVVLSSLPASGVVSVTVVSSNTSEGTVSASPLTFTSSGATAWNVPQVVILTGQGVNVTYLNTPYTITLTASGDTAYNGMTATVSVTNLHLEVPPALPHVWGGSSGGSSGGGCGLTGLEAALLLGLVAAWRRQPRND
jgi:hypothetical protein